MITETFLTLAINAAVVGIAAITLFNQHRRSDRNLVEWRTTIDNRVSNNEKAIEDLRDRLVEHERRCSERTRDLHMKLDNFTKEFSTRFDDNHKEMIARFDSTTKDMADRFDSVYLKLEAGISRVNNRIDVQMSKTVLKENME